MVIFWLWRFNTWFACGTFSLPVSVRPSHAADLSCYLCRWVRKFVFLQHLKYKLPYEAKAFANSVCSQLWIQKGRSIFTKYVFVILINIITYLLMYLFIMLPWLASWWFFIFFFLKESVNFDHVGLTNAERSLKNAWSIFWMSLTKKINVLI